MSELARCNAAVVGIGSTPFGVIPGFDSNALAVRALHEALADAGLKPSDVDGLVMHRVANYQKLCEMHQPRLHLGATSQRPYVRGVAADRCAGSHDGRGEDRRDRLWQ